MPGNAEGLSDGLHAGPTGGSGGARGNLTTAVSREEAAEGGQ